MKANYLILVAALAVAPPISALAQAIVPWENLLTPGQPP
jgi:hypothetical protein